MTGTIARNAARKRPPNNSLYETRSILARSCRCHSPISESCAKPSAATSVPSRSSSGRTSSRSTTTSCGSRATARSSEDLTQEVFLRVYQGLPGFSLRSRFTTWLFQVTKNRVLDELRALERRPRAVVALEDIPPLEVVDAPAERAETIDAVWRAVERAEPRSQDGAAAARRRRALVHARSPRRSRSPSRPSSGGSTRRARKSRLALQRDGVVVPIRSAQSAGRR